MKPGTRSRLSFRRKTHTAIFTVARAQVPDSIPLKVGTPLQLSNEQGAMDVVITEVGPEEITLDANHPLAGKELVFEIEVVDVANK